MKRMVCALLAAGMLLMLTGCDLLLDNGITTKNVSIMEVSGDVIRYRPSCPDCGHDNDSNYCTLYEGEGDSLHSYKTCEECGHAFEFSIERE